MILYVIGGFFAAVGLLFLLWLLRGLFLPGLKQENVALLPPPGRERSILRRYRWMRDLGLVGFRITLLQSALPPAEQRELMEHFPGVRFQTLEEWQIENQERLEENG